MAASRRHRSGLTGNTGPHAGTGISVTPTEAAQHLHQGVSITRNVSISIRRTVIMTGTSAGPPDGVIMAGTVQQEPTLDTASSRYESGGGARTNGTTPPRSPLSGTPAAVGHVSR